MGSAAARADTGAPALAHRFDVFLSYNRLDSAPVERLARRLERAGVKLFLDRWALTPGRPWQQEAFAALQTARACAVFIGSAGLGDWAREELAIACDRAAHDRAFRLFMVLLEGAPRADDPALAVLYTRTWVDLRAGIDDPNAFEDLLAAVRGEPRRRVDSPASTGARCPYRGLAAFGEQDGDDFFGREDDTRRLVERLRSARFVAALGPSGSGKSSLVRAGLVPALRRGALHGSESWNVETLAPGGRPLDTLAARLTHVLPVQAMQPTLDKLADDQRTLDHAVALALDGAPSDTRFVLVVDQLEEVFTLCSDEAQRTAFLANLVYAATIPGGRTIVVCAMRADFYSHCAAHPELRTIIAAQQFLVGPLDDDGLRRAIEEPARRSGVEVERAVVDELLSELRGRPGALPLLQHVLLELWGRRRGSVLTLTSYAESGGVDGALAQRADLIHDALPAPRRVTAERVMLALVQPGEGTEDTRRRIEIGELPVAGDSPEDVEAVVRALADSRLLSTSRDEATGARMVEITHEALLRAWPRLRGWIDRDREALLARRRLSDAAREWEDHGRDTDYLYTGARLAAWQERDDGALGSRERAFLASSRRWAMHRQAAARRRVRLAFAGLGAVLVVVAAAGIVARRASRQAADERDSARSRERAATAALEVRAHPARALRLSLDAYRLAETTEAETMLRQALLEFRAVGGRRMHQGATAAVAVSPEGRRIASAGQDGRVALWEPGKRTRYLLPTRPSAEIPTIAFSPRGDRVAAAGDDRVVRVWTVADSDTARVVGRAPAAVRSVAFDPAGRRLASVDRSGAVRIWNLRQGAPPRALPGSPKTLQAVAFLPDGKHLVAAGHDGMVRIWDVESGTQIAELSAGPKELLALAVAPDGRTIAAAGVQGRVRRWVLDPSGKQPPRPLEALAVGSEVNALAFTRDGRRLAAGAEDGAVRLWDRSGHAVGVLRAFGRPTQSLAPGPGPSELVSGDDDGIVWLWRPGEVTVLEGTGAPINAIDLAPDGRRLAGADARGRVLLWSVPGPAARPQTIATASAGLWSVAFDDTGDEVLAAGERGTLVHHRAAEDATERLPAPSAHTIWRAVFAPVGRVAAASDDGAVRLVAADGSEAQVAIRHAGREYAISVDVSRDGERLISAGTDETVRLARTNPPHRSRVLLRDLVSSAEFAPDGRMIVTAGDDGSVRLWSAAGQPLRTLRGHEGIVWHAGFTADGRRVVSGGEDATVRVWNVDTGSMLVLRGAEGYISRVDADRHARLIAGTSPDGAVRLWTCDACGPMQEVVAAAERRWLP
jgi:WD40 repeat protein